MSRLWWSLLLCVSVVAATPCGRKDLRCLLTDPARQWAANTTVSFPGSDEFQLATERWTVFSPPTYSAAISPGTTEDVVKAVQLMTSHRIPFLVRGAGHAYTITPGTFKGGLAIDLSHQTSVEIDSAAETITVGPGVTIAEIFDPLYDAGFELQTGTASCPSLIGLSLGGGVGRQQGQHGLVLDAMVSLRVITASGDQVEVSKNSHPDLFWAFRGAGANFGVVTSATYSVRPLTNKGNVLNVEFFFTPDQVPAYFEVVESLNGKIPANMAAMNIIQFNPEYNITQLISGWTYFGPEDEGLKFLEPILALSTPVSQSQVPWNRLVATAGGGVDQLICQPNTIRDLYNVNLKNYSAATFQQVFTKMADFYENHPGGRNSIVGIELFPNQAMAAVPLDETAFPWRDATGYIYATFIWGPGDSNTESAARSLGPELRNDLAATSGYDSLTVFVNYARGDEPLESVYGADKLPRLVDLKRTWDPDNVFRYNNGLIRGY
ncbi:unnamed protein product [Clonostachys byssicola]|uniref:FAD-binding PCMH-type domain-containing protein n=1 Tax=Clonostachys byssicola TaxID=160290 RepID=A0A9N9UXZ5_9HYPO|nr:unnamed protein product [Clonostachys byssicola]